MESSDDDGNESSPDTESIESAKEQAQEVVDLLSSTSNEDDGESDVDVSIPEAINITPDLSRADSTNSSSVQQEEDYNNNKSNKKSKSKSTKKSKNSKNNKSNNKNDKRNVDGKNVDQDNEIEVLKASPVARAVALAVKTEVNSSDEEVVKERKRSHLRMLSLPYSNRDDRKRPARLRVQFDRPRPFMRLKQQDTDDHPEDAAKPEIPTSESFAAQGGVVVCEDEEEDDGIFWEIDAVLDYKYHGRRLLWLVSWKNCSETSWVHDDDLCDSAKKDAEVLRQAKRLARKIAHLKGTSEQPVDLCAFDNGSLSSWDMSSSDDESDEDKDDTAYSANGCKKQSKKKQKKRKSGAKQDNKQGKRIRSTKARKSGPTSGSFVIRRLATAPFKKSGGLRPEKNGMAMTFTVSNETQEPDNFLRRLVDGRSILKLEYDTSSKTFPIAQFLDGDNTYSLVAIKNKREKSHKGGGHWGGANQITLKYVQTNGPVRWDPQEELEKVADFQSLPRHKLSSRLELFLTPAMKGPSVHDDWDVSMFETIKEEDSYMGCGFIPHELVKELYSARKKYPVDSLQIRIFAPRIGVVKGMLTPKLGIQKIQIPPSMIKVGPSRKCQDPWAVMVVKTVAPSRYNRDLGKYFESPRLPRETDPNTAPAYQPTLKPLSDMYVQMGNRLDSMSE